MRRPCADRGEKRVTREIGLSRETQFDLGNPKQKEFPKTEICLRYDGPVRIC